MHVCFSFSLTHIACVLCCRWWLLPPEKTCLFVDRFGQLPTDFFAAPDGGFDDCGDDEAAVLYDEGRRHLLELVQVGGGGGGEEEQQQQDGKGRQEGGATVYTTCCVWQRHLGSLGITAGRQVAFQLRRHCGCTEQYLLDQY